MTKKKIYFAMEIIHMEKDIHYRQLLIEIKKIKKETSANNRVYSRAYHSLDMQDKPQRV